MTEILLIQPKFKTHIITPPLGLGYIASVLDQEGYEVQLLDALMKDLSNTQLPNIIRKMQPDIIGISILSCNYKEAQDLISRIKQEFHSDKAPKIIVGGPHVSALPRETLMDTKADFACIGEGEYATLELMRAIKERGSVEHVKGIAYWDKTTVELTPPRELIDKLDTIPFPAWHLIHPAKYPYAPHGAFVKKTPVAPIMTTRGCPFLCTFCAGHCVAGRKLRRRSSGNVVDEIQLLVETYGVKEVHFEDDNFTLIKEHAEGICKELIKRQIDVPWACPNGVRIDTLDKELLELMKRAGCYLLAFGIESGSQAILNTVKKGLDVQTIPKILRKVKEAGIETWGFFIIGLPGETRETVRQTISLAKKLPLDRAQFCIFTPLPGSEIFLDWIQKSMIDLRQINWGDFNFFTGVYETEELRKSDLEELQKIAFREFYFRPRVMFNIVRKIRLRQLKWLLKRILDYRLVG